MDEEEEEEEYQKRRSQAHQAVRQQHFGFLKPWVPNSHPKEGRPRQRDNAVRRHKSFFNPRGSDHVSRNLALHMCISGSEPVGPPQLLISFFRS